MRIVKCKLAYMRGPRCCRFSTYNMERVVDLQYVFVSSKIYLLYMFVIEANPANRPFLCIRNDHPKTSHSFLITTTRIYVRSTRFIQNSISDIHNSLSRCLYKYIYSARCIYVVYCVKCVYRCAREAEGFAGFLYM